MEHPDDAEPYAVDGKLHTAMKAAVADISSMPQGEERTWALRGVASLVMGTPENFKAAALMYCPELSSVEPIPDTHLNVDEQEAASHLTLNDLQAIDNALMARTANSWRSVARVIGEAMASTGGRVQAPPLGVFMRRVNGLVQNGSVEVQGNAQYMRLSEIRLTTNGAGAA